MGRTIDKRLTALEGNVRQPPCKTPGHDPLAFLFVFTGRNGNEREVEEKIAEIRTCEECGDDAQFVMFIFGDEAVKPAAPTVAGWDGLELN